MKKLLKKYAKLRKRDPHDETNVVVFEVEGDWNDGDEVSTTHYIDETEIEAVIQDIKNDDLSNWAPSGIPDNTEFHSLWVNEFYFIDKKGNYFEIDIKD